MQNPGPTAQKLRCLAFHLLVSFIRIGPKSESRGITIYYKIRGVSTSLIDPESTI